MSCKLQTHSALFLLLALQGSNVSELQDLMDQLQQEALISQRVTRPASGELLGKGRAIRELGSGLGLRLWKEHLC